jgi:hypothetical protein
LIFALKAPPGLAPVKTPRASTSTKGRGGRRGSRPTSTANPNRKGGRVPNRYGAYTPVPRVLDLGPGRLLVYVLPPKVRALLTIAELLIWLFWPTANQPGPKQPQTLDQFSPDEPFLGPVVPYGPYMWTRQHRSYEIVIPPPRQSKPAGKRIERVDYDRPGLDQPTRAGLHWGVCNRNK